MKNYIKQTQSEMTLFGKIIISGSILLFLGFLIFLSGCQKIEEYKKYNKDGSSSKDKTNYYVRLTDAPGDFTQVNIDIQSVFVKTNGGKDIKLNVNPGIYNLLNFQNGVDTLIASGGLEPTTISQIRLILGNQNTVMVDSVLYSLSVPSGSQSGLKLQVHHELQAGVDYHVLLDFVANQSIVKTGNGKYMLKPVIRTIDSAISGSIKGIINPIGVATTISTTFNGVTYTTNADANGYFLLKGLPPGTYDLTITPIAPYSVQQVNGVIVIKGLNTNTGIINL